MFRGISQEEKLLLRRIMIQIFDNLKEEPRFHTSGESKQRDKAGKESV